MITKEALLEMLERTPLFGALAEADRKAVLQEMRETSFDGGQAIFARGDPGRDVYLVTSGRVRLSVLTAEGRELSFAHAEPGQIFGEIAVLDGGMRSADATAVSKVSALTLSKGALTRLIEQRPEVRDAIIKFLCNRLREADHQLEGIALYPIEVRLARFFLAAARQKGELKPGAKIVIDLPISQSELALLIGASRPKVNAALSLLEGSGAISRKETRFTCDIDELEATAGA
ncbi:Crp/Fnr family transcriptional regulator [Hyphomicrobium sp. CS1GBMeth3]|uniref:Crp/Fnr family transcriptional regulator n=1 Tax=Hyphomicrobium sp. CS1GBMeth3 TaxID=1892845 RepID=UPI000930EEAA|nr:Crp/Fnr family transcriptional regulator [Hyphomicrobium sp. CS1GBMeth3]